MRLFFFFFFFFFFFCARGVRQVSEGAGKLKLQIYDEDFLERDDCLGQATLDLRGEMARALGRTEEAAKKSGGGASKQRPQTAAPRQAVPWRQGARLLAPPQLRAPQLVCFKPFTTNTKARILPLSILLKLSEKRVCE